MLGFSLPILFVNILRKNYERLLIKFSGKVYIRVRAIETIETDWKGFISHIKYQNNRARLRTITVSFKMKLVKVTLWVSNDVGLELFQMIRIQSMFVILSISVRQLCRTASYDLLFNSHYWCLYLPVHYFCCLKILV